MVAPTPVRSSSRLHRRRPITPLDTGRRPHWMRRLRRFVAPAAWAGLGVVAFVGLWALIAWRSEGVPTPTNMVSALRKLLVNPVTDNGPDGKGALLLVWASLFRVLKGFTVAALVGIPLGLLIGSVKRVWMAVNPLVQLLRPVSPLAWYPLGLVALHDAPKAQTFVIFITALWPVVVNTAAGAASVPSDHANVARVFRFSRWQRIRHVLLPAALPGVVTGLRLSMGVAWMVIVAVEMLAGASGIGGFVWEAYNASNLAAVTAAIMLIGAVGLMMDSGFQAIGRRVAPVEEKP